MKGFNPKLILALLCSLAIISFVSGRAEVERTNLRRGSNEEHDFAGGKRLLQGNSGKGSKSSKGKGGKGGKGSKSSKSPKSDGKGGKGSKSSKSPGSKGKGGKGSKSSKSPGSKGKGGKGTKSSKSPDSSGKGTKSLKSPKSSGKGGKGVKSSKSPSDSGKGGKGTKSMKSPKRSGKAVKSSKAPKSSKSGKSGKAPKSSKSGKAPKSSKSGKSGKSSKSSKAPKSSKSGKSPTGSPTSICGIPEVDRISKIRAIISEVSSLSAVDTAGTDQNLAYEWLISDGDDSLFVCPEDKQIVLERYILAVLYFATSGDDWDKCNRIKECTGTGSQSYLNKASVCEWFGIECDNGAVSRVELGGDDFFVGVDGVMPDELFSLSEVTRIVFDGSKDKSDLRRIRGSIPRAIKNAKNLTYLDVDRNELTGPIPDEIFEVKTLQLIDLDNNQLDGLISDRFGEFEDLFFATIGNNKFSSQPMPEAFTKPNGMTVIGLQNSRLTGPIPEAYRQLTTIAAFDVSFNQLSGTIDVLEGYSGLINLVLNNNNFRGEIPQSIWENKFTSILDLSNNSFEGQISSAVSGMKDLVTLKLAGNNFTGGIPAELGDLGGRQGKLKFLTLEGNNFGQGTIVPASLCEIPEIEITISADIQCPGDCCIIIQ